MVCMNGLVYVSSKYWVTISSQLVDLIQLNIY